MTEKDTETEGAQDRLDTLAPGNPATRPIHTLQAETIERESARIDTEAVLDVMTEAGTGRGTEVIGTEVTVETVE